MRLQGDLPRRSFHLALTILDLVDALPQGTKGWVIGRQLLKSGTSVGANLEEANHALTEAEFASFCNVARREAAETAYWLRLCVESGLLSSEAVTPAQDQAIELTRILSSIVRKTKAHIRQK